MEYLLALINNLIADEQSARLIFLGVIAASAVFFMLAVNFVINSYTNPVRVGLKKARAQPRLSFWRRNKEKVASALAPTVPEGKERSRIEETLLHAGYEHDHALAFFFGLKLMLTIGSVVGTLLALRYFSQLSLNQVMLLTGVAAYLSFILPTYILERIANARVSRMRREFPDALDLLIVCTESGLGMHAALQRAAQELAFSHGELAHELKLVSVRTQAGISLGDSLKELGPRTGVDEIRGLVRAISQSVHLGTGIAQTLRTYAEELRVKNMQVAEEKAAKVSVKMIFPLVTCIWPSFFIVAVGPAVIGVLAVFKS